MKVSIDFDDKEIKKLLAELDYEYYLKMNIYENSYPQESIDRLYLTHAEIKKKLSAKSKANKRQFNYFVESQMRLSCSGGALPSVFKLNDAREYRIFDFEAMGKEWAYFEYWKRYQKRKITIDKIWEIIIKVGSLLGIILTLITIVKFIWGVVHPEEPFE